MIYVRNPIQENDKAVEPEPGFDWKGIALGAAVSAAVSIIVGVVLDKLLGGSR